MLLSIWQQTTKSIIIVMFEFKTFETGTPDSDYWDMQLIKDMNQYSYIKPLINDKYKIVVIPARQNVKRIKEINKYLGQFYGVVLILTGDEENVFPVEEIKHDNIKIWLMTPSREHTKVDRYLPNGYSPHTHYLAEFHKEYLIKGLEWFFAGQITHSERKRLAKSLGLLQGGLLFQSEGFTQGIEKREYIRNMASAMVVPCPSGAVMPDSFRVYEALEAGAVPVVLDKNLPYFQKIFGDNPIRSLDKWENFGDYVRWFIDTYPFANNITMSWWIEQKHKMFQDLMFDFQLVGGSVESSEILVVIPTSPTPIHPETRYIEEVLDSVVSRLPNSKVLILADGIRGEQIKFTESYQEYIKRLLFLVKWKYKNVSLKMFEIHHHQAGMMKKIINEITQKQVLFVEHDTPLCEDIPFNHLISAISDGIANMIRLHHEALILPDHRHLMLNEVEYRGILLTETAQWSQRPHLASVDFYRKILDNFSENSNSMIEDKMFGVVADAYRRSGRAGWNEYRLMIYTPLGDMKRSYHLDTRGKEPKFEMIY